MGILRDPVFIHLIDVYPRMSVSVCVDREVNLELTSGASQSGFKDGLVPVRCRGAQRFQAEPINFTGRISRPESIRLLRLPPTTPRDGCASDRTD
ncbi:unnamed protein product [Protopolystoma xenopodis]|uniref:Uncharacterized protein n=1 Tax=Protopolystoma xenopodis TaxID=117903 RepID=A0A448XLJ0_9PLAT|nr:unnamed protein product [Protopolystoma xenopodis]